MLKNILATFLVAVTLVSCSLDNDNENLVLKTLPIKAYEVPEEFEFGMSYTLKVEYDLPDACHSFYNLYYQYDGSSRKVAITSVADTKGNCNEVIIPRVHEFVVSVKQTQDYIFKFWKGEDAEGNDIFEDVVVPVIN